MSMQFWGLEVKAKEPSKVSLDDGRIIHLSQATLSDVKKETDPVTVSVTVDNKKFVLGVLTKSNPQLSFDLVFETEFEISHNFKNGSVHFLGYQTEMPSSDGEMFGDSSDEEEDEEVPVLQKENGKAAPASAAVAKPKVAAKPVKSAEEDSDEDDSDDSDDDDLSDGESIPFSDSEDDDDDDDEEDEMSEDEKPVPVPAKAESGKKRANADAKTPESKKAKLVTPQKTDGKKGAQTAHTATPHPSKKGGKTPVGDKATPKSAGSASCDSCKKTFNSDNALQSHNKAKHAAK
ncbi:hypothetical protein SOVF_177620 [Spinacia oleracea]|uniref:Histone deacetylase HDT2 n=1 Tax=Spinacia oleracea TaxID=3562 RepID=A0A9R0JXD8_SPIOL|nr:histone deacetylase HDT2-like [Spinacia oleracea]KNA06810.1 hypothetical protein SOVF_177620 [Spinacia oleracea]